jgi:photosystem II stability/assembly factor-like uncharacterized protein
MPCSLRLCRIGRAILAGMEFRPNWKVRWFSIAVLMLPTLVLIVYSLRYPAVHAKGKEGVFAYLEDKPDASAASGLSWTMQESGTTASLRGIDSVDGKVAWASGTEGTVLKTVDGGAHWAKCAVPDGATDGATLDFRGVQAWDATTAIVMASGPGDKSRLYKTADGCKSWKLLLKNTDKDGFWDALYFKDNSGRLLGDPVNGAFALFASSDSGQHWIRQRNRGIHVEASEQGAFAASNSSLVEVYGAVMFSSGGKGGAFVYSVVQTEICVDDCSEQELNLDGRKDKWARETVPVGVNSESSGAFSVAARGNLAGGPRASYSAVIVGGDYTKPNETIGTAAYSTHGGKTWTAAEKPPHGFRSAVAWSEALKAWIAAGTNGSDISRDDGKTWAPLDDGNWNALSLPFVVGPKGRIARLSASVGK